MACNVWIVIWGIAEGSMGTSDAMSIRKDRDSTNAPQNSEPNAMPDLRLKEGKQKMLSRSEILQKLRNHEVASGLRNCHHVGLHSLVVKERPDGSLLRIFYTTPEHRMNYLFDSSCKHFTLGAHNHNKQLRFQTLYGDVDNVELALHMAPVKGLYQGYMYPFHTSALLEGGFSLGNPENVGWNFVVSPIHGKCLSTSDIHTVLVCTTYAAWVVDEGPIQDVPKYILSPNKGLTLDSTNLYIPGDRDQMCEEILKHVE